MKKLHIIAFILLVIGGLNWLMVGIANQDIGSVVFGGTDKPVAKLIYLLVGLAAIFEVATHKGRCKACERGTAMNTTSSMR